jgi:hypothetical protein
MSLKRLGEQVGRMMAGDMSKVRMIVHVLVSQIIFPDNVGEVIENGSFLSVSLVRGGKISTSKEKFFDMRQGATSIMPMDETIELVATLYQDNKTKAFQKKKGKLILREKKQGKGGAALKRRLGLHILDLDQVAKQMTEAGEQTHVAEMLIPIELPPTSTANVSVASIKVKINLLPPSHFFVPREVVKVLLRGAL